MTTPDEPLPPFLVPTLLGDPPPPPEPRFAIEALLALFPLAAPLLAPAPPPVPPVPEYAAPPPPPA